MSKKRRAKKDKEKILAIVMILFVGGCLFFVLFNFFSAKQNEVAVDASTQCSLDGDFSRDTVILLDATDSVSEAQMETIRNHIEEKIEDSYLYERFSVYSLKDDPNKFQPQFIACNPGDGKDTSSIIGSPRKIFKAWKSKFRDPILDKVESLVLDTSSESSPIMEMLKFVGIRTMSRSGSNEKRIILVSDMVENTSRYSQYKSTDVDFKSLKDMPYFREVRPKLNNVKVELMYIERASLSDIQGKEHIQKFWKPFIEESKGRLSSVTYIN